MKKLVSRSLIAAALLCWTGYVLADAPNWRQGPPPPNYQTESNSGYRDDFNRSYRNHPQEQNREAPYAEYQAKPGMNANHQIEVRYKTDPEDRGYRNAPIYRKDTPQPRSYDSYDESYDYDGAYDSDDNDLFVDSSSNPPTSQRQAHRYDQSANEEEDELDDDDTDDTAMSNAEAFKSLVNSLRTLKLSGDSLTLNYETIDGKTFELDLPNVDADLKFEHKEGNHVVHGTVDAKMSAELYSKATDKLENNAKLHLEGTVTFSSWESLERLADNFFLPGDAHFVFDLTKYSWTSDYGSYTGKGLFSFERKKDISTINYVEDSAVTITSKYDEFVRAMIKQQIQESHREDLKEHIDDWVDLSPKPSTWGDIKNDHNYEVVCKLSPEGDIQDLNLDVKKSRMTVGSYGIDWTMRLKAKNNFQEYDLAAHVQLMNYKSLIDELAKYANRWITTSNKYAANEKEKMPLVDDQDKAEVVALFKKLSKNPNSDEKDWITDISLNNSQDWKIGTLNVDQAKAEINKVWDRFSDKFQTKP